MKIMVFLQGTTLMHPSARGRSREERVQQVVTGEGSVTEFASYIPVDDAVPKLLRWRAQGAEIVYLSSHRDAEDAAIDRAVLAQNGFPQGPVFFRQGSEGYEQVVARISPDVLIEDDCESIGGTGQMIFPQLPPELRTRIRSIVVKEFGGVGHLPDDIRQLMA